MSRTEVTKDIRYVGVNDREIDLFESQYIVPNGVSYNSYLIMDEKIALMDTVDARKTDEWLLQVKEELAGNAPDYLVISHLEPDHAGSIAAIVSAYPEMKLVGNAKTFSMFPQFFKLDIEDKKVVVSEGETLCLGQHTLQFFMAPMVHWPEVMVTYEQTDKVLFSADGFGKFGALDTEEDWACEARRYYFNIVGKYGAMVQALLKKAAALDIQIICPLHGPVLKENLSYYIEKYDTWSSYRAEDTGVLVAFASIHGNTAQAAARFADMLRENGVAKVVTADLTREDVAEVIEDAFRYDRMVLCCATYDGGIFPCMEDFLHHLKAKGFQKRTVGLVENGSWAPMAAKSMRKLLEEMKDINIVEPVVSIRSTMDERVEKELRELADIVANTQ
ncbi:MAG: FprA family A-type flavoprotein [Lachnospiraceae bacterium]|nr:FprA family A-type flavoprotein [Lachnospiraceae bacterium]